MDSLQEVVEREVAPDRDDDFAVHGEFLGLESECSADDVRKVTREVFAALGQHRDIVGLSRKDAAKPVPLGLVLPIGALRYFASERMHLTRPGAAIAGPRPNAV